MAKLCSKCSVPISDECHAAWAVTGKWFCDNCDSEEFLEWKKNREKFNPKEWKWRNYYGLVRDLTGFNQKEPMEPNIPIDIAENTCLECEENSTMKNFLICEDCWKKYEKIRRRVTAKCKICNRESSLKYCEGCLFYQDRVKVIKEIIRLRNNLK